MQHFCSIYDPIYLLALRKIKTFHLTHTGFLFCFKSNTHDTTDENSLQTKHLCQFHKFPNDRHFQPSFLFSILIFLTGFFINLHSDSILRNLRNQCKGYQIPRDGMFRYVSGANHFGEILEWFGYALASDFTTPTLAFFMYTCGNLIPRALSTHTWYLQKFEDYPKNRKAVLPFIF